MIGSFTVNVTGISNTLFSQYNLMKKHITGLFLLATIFLTSIYFVPYQPLASDEVLINRFRNHRTNFEKLLKMITEDANVRDVSEFDVALSPTGDKRPFNFEYWKEGDPGFSKIRWNEYKNLFNQLGSSEIYGLSKNDETLQIKASSADLRIDDYKGICISKGYIHSPQKPFRVVESLNDLEFENQGFYYKQIEGNWYLYFYGFTCTAE
jgi:hypothetical protein